MSEAKDENGTTAATNAAVAAAEAGVSQRPPSPHSHYTRASGSSGDGEVDSVHNGEGEDEDDNGLDRFSTRQSMGPDAVMEPASSVVQIPEDYYDRLPPSRKMIILALVSYCAFLAPISSTSVLAATPEVADEYATSGSIINLVNALYMLFMGISPIVWGPLSQVYGRRMVSPDSTQPILDGRRSSTNTNLHPRSRWSLPSGSSQVASERLWRQISRRSSSSASSRP